MYKGTQSELVKELGCSRTAISKLVKAEDYRIIYLNGGKRIDIEKSLGALIDSGFGKRSKPIKAKPKKKTKKTGGKSADEIDNGKPSSITDSRQMLEKRKAFYQAEKVRIDNEEKLGRLINVDEVGERSFNLFRQLRDSIQSIKDRCTIKIRSAQTDHEAEQILNDEIHDILNSIVSGYQNLDEDAVKKKLIASLTA